MVVSSFLTIHYIMITLHQTLKIRYALNHFKPLICTFSLNNIIGRYIKKKKKSRIQYILQTIIFGKINLKRNMCSV